MAGYADTKKLIEESLVGRPEGTLIYPKEHQAFALQMLDYIRSVELMGASTLQGIATPATVPVQPNNGRVSYIATVPAGTTYTFTNFHQQNGNSIFITSGPNTVSLVTLLWNGEYWTAQNNQVQLMLNIVDGYLYAGIALPETTPNPVTPDEPCYYIAATAGTYGNFGGIVVNEGEVAFLKWNGTGWTKEVTGLASSEELSRLGQDAFKPFLSNVIQLFSLQGHIKYADGTLSESNNRKTTPFIPLDGISDIETFELMATSNVAVISFWNENKEYMQSISIPGSTNPNDVNRHINHSSFSSASYVRFSVSTDFVNSCRIKLNSIVGNTLLFSNLLGVLDERKQNKLTFDEKPIAVSNHPVTSNGVYLAFTPAGDFVRKDYIGDDNTLLTSGLIQRQLDKSLAFSDKQFGVGDESFNELTITKVNKNLSINLEGNISEGTSTAYYYSQIEVQEGERYRCTFCQYLKNNNALQYIFEVDQNGKVLQYYAKPDDTTYIVNTVDLIIGNGTKYLYVQSSNNSVFGTDRGKLGIAKYNATNTNIQEDLSIVERYGVTPLTFNVGFPILDNARNRALAHSKDVRCLNFAFITDTHYRRDDLYNRECINNLQLFGKFCRERIADFGIHCGDIITDYGCTIEEDIAMIDDTMQLMGESLVPMFYAKGNHENNPSKQLADLSDLDWVNNDYYIYDYDNHAYVQVYDPAGSTLPKWNGTDRLFVGATDQVITDTQYSLMFDNNLPSICKYGMSGCYYADFETNKVRAIVVNRFPVTITINSIRSWLATVALNLTDKTNPADWGVVIFLHFAGYFDTIIKDFQDSTGNNGYKDFTGEPTKRLIAVIHGHTHSDEYSNENGYNYIGVTRGFSEGSEIGTPNEFRFDIFSIDTANKVIYETRVGAGVDRFYTFGESSNINP